MSMTDLDPRAAELAHRPYTFTLIHDKESDTWTSAVLEVPGAISDGAGPNEAIEMVRETLELMIDHRLRSGDEVPEPFETREWSGEMRLRMTPELHRRVSALAAHESVSLNRWLSAAIARESASADVLERPSAGVRVAEETEDYSADSPDPD
jgi:predicted HicB family RNase H-like nuclease